VRWPVRVVETRSATELQDVLVGYACPIVVLDLADRVRSGLEDLDRAALLAPNALILVLDPKARAGVASLARELGATLVISGPVPPPQVAELLSRWLPLARRRAEGDGWSTVAEPAAEPWDGPIPNFVANSH
jgi:CheY-like chemotaxis protein